MANTARRKRSEQISLLKDAAVALAELLGNPKEGAGYDVVEVNLGTLEFWISSWPLVTQIDLWVKTPDSGQKVLNMSWSNDGTIQVVSFRRGDWEQTLLDRAKQTLN